MLLTYKKSYIERHNSFFTEKYQNVFAVFVISLWNHKSMKVFSETLCIAFVTTQSMIICKKRSIHQQKKFVNHTFVWFSRWCLLEKVKSIRNMCFSQEKGNLLKTPTLCELKLKI